MGRRLGTASGLACTVLLAGCGGLTARLAVDLNAGGTISAPVRPGTEIRVYTAGEEKIVWRDENGSIRWSGRTETTKTRSMGCVCAGTVPVFEPLTRQNTIEVGDRKVHFEVAEPLPASPGTIFVNGTTVAPRLEGWQGLIESPNPAIVNSGIEPFTAWILSDPVMHWDQPLVEEMARGLFALRSALRPEDYGVAVAVLDDVLRSKIRKALIMQAGVWPSETGKARIVVTAKGEAASGESLTIEVDDEKDIERLVARIKELCPPQINVVDDEGNPVPATVHSFRGGSVQVFLIDPAETSPPRVHVRSERGGFWCDVRRGVVLGNGKEAMIPGRAPEPFVIALLPYTVKKLEARAKRVIDGGMLLDIAVVADGPVTAPHIVEIYAAGDTDEAVPGSIRVVKLKRGQAQRWYQWGEGTLSKPKKIVGRDVLTGFRAELPVPEPAAP